MEVGLVYLAEALGLISKSQSQTATLVFSPWQYSQALSIFENVMRLGSSAGSLFSALGSDSLAIAMPVKAKKSMNAVNELRNKILPPIGDYSVM